MPALSARPASPDAGPGTKPFESVSNFIYQEGLEERERVNETNRPPRWAPRSGAALLLASAWALAACAGAPLGASDANLAKAKDQTSLGAKVYAANCSGCHGDRGQGRRGPQLMGPGALPEYPRDSSDTSRQFTDPQEIDQQVQTRPPGTPSREPFENAGDVFSFVSTQMPPGKQAGSLKPDEYWAVVNFVLVAHGVPVPAGGVTPENASSIGLEPR